MELWTGLPVWVRWPVSFGLIAAGLGILFFADRVPLKLVGLLVGLGFVGLLIGPSDSDKKGYKF